MTDKDEMDNPVECPECGETFDIGPVEDWEFVEFEDGAGTYSGATGGECPKCGVQVNADYQGTAPGHPDIGNPIENVELVDIYTEGD